MATQAELDNWFRYHSPTPEQIDAFGVLRADMKLVAHDFNRLCPDSADKTAAMRKLREATMAMNLAISCYQKPTIESLEAILKSDEQTPITINPDGSMSVDEA